MPNSAQSDIDEFLGDSDAVVAVEIGWLTRITQATLRCYQFDAVAFECLDAGAGYFVSRTAIVPEAVTTLGDLPRAIREAGADFRTLDNLWTLHDAVARSTLQFSMIRMRNAAPRSPP